MTTSYGIDSDDSILILYKVANSKSDHDGLYNAFRVPRCNVVSLNHVKKNCFALYSLSPAGPDRFHWRVCIEDTRTSHDGSKTDSFSWLDVGDEDSHLPVMRLTPKELEYMLYPSVAGSRSDHGVSTTKGAKGGFQMLSKVVNAVVDSGNSDSSPVHTDGPRLDVILFKLLDLVKVHDDFGRKRCHWYCHGKKPTQAPPSPMQAPTPAPIPVPYTAPAPRPTPPQSSRGPKVASSNADSHAPTKAPTPAPAPVSNTAPAQRSQGSKVASSNADSPSPLIPDMFPMASVSPSDSGGKNNRGTTGTSAPPTTASPPLAVPFMDASSKALQELRRIQEVQKQEAADEDEARKRLESKIKIWSEEHGKKKQLRALLASLDTILWPQAKWKPVTIGDILTDVQVKKCFHKASRVVHPDRTRHLDAEKRFLSKRIFDALCQAKQEMEEATTN